ncbi:hypothetical protein BY996DRAFT_6812734 [Phakopsora pachyrhizi]|nr:hypothetical protein BY996DRAFT_6812734 [Phakopsora pachyrhizi]
MMMLLLLLLKIDLMLTVLLKLSTPFILTDPSESSASEPHHSVHQQNSGCWKLQQPGWLWENHLSTLCSVSSSTARLGHIHQPADLRLRLESTLATLREIYQVRGLGDGQGLGLTDQVVILHRGDPRHRGWPDLTGAIRLQQSGDPQSVLVSLPSGLVSDLLELLPSDLVATCQNPLTECLPTRTSVRQQQGTLSETFFRQRLRGLRYDWRIDRMINDADRSIHRLKLLGYISALTGQRIPRSGTDGRIDPCGNTQKEGPDEEAYETGWRNRNSFSSGGFRAVEWLRRTFESNGLGDCRLERYMSSVSPNLICSYRSSSQPSNSTPGDGEDLLPAVVLSAHYDSKAGFGDLFAPGADNDASGCSILLSISESIRRFPSLFERLTNDRSKDRPSFELYFFLFSGTEQGLLGSEHLSKSFKPEILCLLNLNMISYRGPGEPYQLGITSPLSNVRRRSNDERFLLIDYLKGIGTLYVPQLLIGFNDSIVSSDERNFQRQPSKTQNSSDVFMNSLRLTERIGPLINPNYLKSSDLFFDSDEEDYSIFEKTEGECERKESDLSRDLGFRNGYCIVQTRLIGQVILAFVIDLIGL